jgi:TRAP-type C4-dicarboxylate transport system permease small subunit
MRAAQFLSFLVVAGFGGVLIYYGLRLMELGQFQQTPVMELSKSYIYASMPVGGVLIIVYALPTLWRRP